jgi:hypothetical protein
MFRRDALMAHADGNGLRALQKALGAIREFLNIHIKLSLFEAFRKASRPM